MGWADRHLGAVNRYGARLLSLSAVSTDGGGRVVA
jgi:hypothetical protein